MAEARDNAPDARLAKFAARQHDVISTDQLYGLGLSGDQVCDRARNGRLHRIHRGVYAVGTPALTREGRFMAAVLACGEGAALSHVAAGWLWELRKGLLSPVDVTVPTTAGRRARAGIRIHRTSEPVEATSHRGIRVTTPARTLLDLAEVLTPRQLERALDEADHLGLLHLPTLHRALHDHPNKTGAARLARVLRHHEPGTTRTRSEAEEDFLGFCRRHDLPRPILNAEVEGLSVDALFSDQRVVVEIDPWHTHRDRRAFAGDRARDRRLLAAGYRTARITDEQLTPQTAAELRRILA
ncbi:MAG TPA: type IV toxin-antitoxin system AbiEi family antitoxin domain-containing protein [Solirubrobacteraceae bacterium]|nr:type IV toxin-antitoxin system AbiEi family antitoxin domain-containing protein [Solirubrobacteraceae bacterium]